MTLSLNISSKVAAKHRYDINTRFHVFIQWLCGLLQPLSHFGRHQSPQLPAWGGSSCGSELWTSSSGTEPAACCVSVSSWPSPSASPRRSQSPTRPAAAGGSACGAASSSWPLCDARHRRPRLLHRRWRTMSCCRHRRRRLYLSGTSASCRQSSQPALKIHNCPVFFKFLYLESVQDGICLVCLSYFFIRYKLTLVSTELVIQTMICVAAGNTNYTGQDGARSPGSFSMYLFPSSSTFE